MASFSTARVTGSRSRCSAPTASVPTTASDLGQHALLPLRRAGEQIERPGQRLGGGLVAGGEEGHEVVDELLFRHRLPGLGVLRRASRASRSSPSRPVGTPPRQDAGDGGRAACARPCVGGICPDTTASRETQHRRRDVPGDGGERRIGSLQDGGGLRVGAAGEHGRGDDVEGGLRSCRGRSRAMAPGRCRAPARHLILGRGRHGRNQARRGRPGGRVARRCGAASASWRPRR